MYKKAHWVLVISIEHRERLFANGLFSNGSDSLHCIQTASITSSGDPHQRDTSWSCGWPSSKEVPAADPWGGGNRSSKDHMEDLRPALVKGSSSVPMGETKGQHNTFCQRTGKMQKSWQKNCCFACCGWWKWGWLVWGLNNKLKLVKTLEVRQ